MAYSSARVPPVHVPPPLLGVWGFSGLLAWCFASSSTCIAMVADPRPEVIFWPTCATFAAGTTAAKASSGVSLTLSASAPVLLICVSMLTTAAMAPSSGTSDFWLR